jgi:hypothetical protein
VFYFGTSHLGAKIDQNKTMTKISRLKYQPHGKVKETNEFTSKYQPHYGKVKRPMNLP